MVSHDTFKLIQWIVIYTESKLKNSTSIHNVLLLIQCLISLFNFKIL